MQRGTWAGMQRGTWAGCHLELISSDGAIIVGVNGLEELSQALDFLGGEAPGHHHVGRLLQLGHARKLQAHM